MVSTHFFQRSQLDFTQWILLCQLSETPTATQPPHNPAVICRTAGFELIAASALPKHGNNADVQNSPCIMAL